ncbi:hypothetical protein HLB35_07655 [Halomonas sp. TBZ9]|uniref:EpsG family protein n=1 Tax=Vreelandella azerica TaxID=2732867 RepID=A0A7Y3XAX5_9GAMM|nr:EpsG family protein [Halomonas azerica]NOG31680.1 hypothetical protein [Halomonas azerica]
MTLAIYIVLLVVCIVGVKLNSKSYFLQFIIVCLITYLMGRGALTADTFYYHKGYVEAQSLSFLGFYEPGYLLLEKIGNALGLSYVEFRLMVVFFAWIAISVFLNKVLSRKVFLFYLFYCVFLIFIDTVQIRSFLAFSIVVYALKFLLFEKRLHVYVFFCFIGIYDSYKRACISYFWGFDFKEKGRSRLFAFIIFTNFHFCVIFSRW